MFWNNELFVGPILFVRMLQLFSYKRAKLLKADRMVTCPVHVVLLNMRARIRNFLTTEGSTVVGFLRVRTEVRIATDSGDLTPENGIGKASGDRSIVDMCNYVALTSMSKGRVQKMALLHTEIRELLDRLYKQCHPGFIVCSSNKSVWNYFSYTVSYWCNIPEVCLC